MPDVGERRRDVGLESPALVEFAYDVRLEKPAVQQPVPKFVVGSLTRPAGPAGEPDNIAAPATLLPSKGTDSVGARRRRGTVSRVALPSGGS